MTPAQLTEFIRPIITQHVQVIAEPHFTKCRCGWEVPRRHSGTQRHHKHLATVIAHHILGTEKP